MRRDPMTHVPISDFVIDFREICKFATHRSRSPSSESDSTSKGRGEVENSSTQIAILLRGIKIFKPLTFNESSSRESSKVRGLRPDICNLRLWQSNSSRLRALPICIHTVIAKQLSSSPPSAVPVARNNLETRRCGLPPSLRRFSSKRGSGKKKSKKGC